MVTGQGPSKNRPTHRGSFLVGGRMMNDLVTELKNDGVSPHLDPPLTQVPRAPFPSSYHDCLCLVLSPLHLSFWRRKIYLSGSPSIFPRFWHNLDTPGPVLCCITSIGLIKASPRSEERLRSRYAVHPACEQRQSSHQGYQRCGTI